MLLIDLRLGAVTTIYEHRSYIYMHKSSKNYLYNYVGSFFKYFIILRVNTILKALGLVSLFLSSTFLRPINHIKQTIDVNIITIVITIHDTSKYTLIQND